MELALVLAYAGFAALLIAVPGPDWALVLGAGTRPGLLAPVVGGLGLGYVGITTAIAVGLAPLVTRTPLALTALSIVGAIYLLFVGVGMLRAPVAELAATSLDGRGSLASALRQGSA